MPYKHVFSRLYPLTAISDHPLDKVFQPSPDGRLLVHFAKRQEEITILETKADMRWSTEVITETTPDTALTDDRRYRAQIVKQSFDGKWEYWLQHVDRATGRSRQVRLNAEVRARPVQLPRVSISPQGHYFLTDDDGTVRLFTAQHLADAGVFQVAHASADNFIVSLAISAQETIVAGLSSWKDIVLYNIPDRKLLFIRQIRDRVGWYDQGPGLIAIADEGEAVISIGTGSVQNSTQEEATAISVNVFRHVPLPKPDQNKDSR